MSPSAVDADPLSPRMRTVAVQANPTMQTCLMQIGDVADRTGLSLRTIRHYEEVGLLPEAQRSAGGFRLYTEDAVARLLLIKRMKPLEFSLEEMRDLIETRDRLVGPRLDEGTRNSLLERLATYQSLVEHKLAVLRERVDNAQSFADQLRDDMAANPHHP